MKTIAAAIIASVLSSAATATVVARRSDIRVDLPTGEEAVFMMEPTRRLPMIQFTIGGRCYGFIISNVGSSVLPCDQLRAHD